MWILIGFAASAVFGGVVVGCVIKLDLAQATHEREKAERLLRDADEMLAAAEKNAVNAEALTTPTSEMAIVQPFSVRVRLAGMSAREWARETFLAPATEPAWAPAELASLAPARPPLRARGEVAATRRSWPLMPRLLPPSPLFDAAPFSLSSLGGAQ